MFENVSETSEMALGARALRRSYRIGGFVRVLFVSCSERQLVDEVECDAPLSHAHFLRSPVVLVIGANFIDPGVQRPRRLVLEPILLAFEAGCRSQHDVFVL